MGNAAFVWTTGWSFHLSPGENLSVADYPIHTVVVHLPGHLTFCLDVNPKEGLTLYWQLETWRGKRGCWSSTANTVLPHPVSGWIEVLVLHQVRTGVPPTIPPSMFSCDANASVINVYRITLSDGGCSSLAPMKHYAVCSLIGKTIQPFKPLFGQSTMHHQISLSHPSAIPWMRSSPGWTFSSLVVGWMIWIFW